MKRRIISILAVCCLMVAMMPAAFAAGTTMDETAFRNAVAQGGTVTMTGDVTLTSPLSITKGVTIDGTSSKYSIDYNGGSNALTVSTNETVRLQNLELNATENNGRGINLTSSSPKLYLTGVTMNVNARGISFVQSGDATGAVVSLDQSHILNSRVTGSYEENTTIGDTRGISIFDVKDSDFTLTNSSIKGFGYSINLSGAQDTDGIRNAQGTKVTVTGSQIWGWTAFNIWTCNTIFDITNSDLRGINVSNGSTDGFAAVVLNDNIYGNLATPLYNTLTFTGGSIGGYKYGTASEGLIRIGNQLSTRISFELYNGADSVIFKSNVPNFNFTFTGNLTSDEIDYYLYESGLFTGADNIENQFPTSTYAALPQLSYEVIE